MDPVVKNESVEYKNSTRKFTWKIDDFKKFYDQTENTKGIESQKHSVFSDANPKKLLFKWYFELYPKGQNKSCENALSINLNTEPLKIPFFHVNGIWSIKDEKGNKITSKRLNCKFDKNADWGSHEFLPKDYINKHAITKTLSFEADLTFSFCNNTLPLTEEPDSDYKSISFPNKRMSQDISVYLNNDVFSDVTISAGDQKYYAHKFILSARSPVFAAMFAHDFKENNDNLVTVEESPTVFYQILEYIYSNKIPNKETVSEEIYAAAHKYNLEELQDDCQALLGNSITIENVLKRLECADLHNIKHLKKKSMKFIKHNIKTIIKSDEWKKIMTTNVDLATEVLEFVHS